MGPSIRDQHGSLLPYWSVIFGKLHKFKVETLQKHRNLIKFYNDLQWGKTGSGPCFVTIDWQDSSIPAVILYRTHFWITSFVQQIWSIIFRWIMAGELCIMTNWSNSPLQFASSGWRCTYSCRICISTNPLSRVQVGYLFHPYIWFHIIFIYMLQSNSNEEF